MGNSDSKEVFTGEDPYNRLNWNKYYTTLDGGGKFLGVSEPYDCWSCQGNPKVPNSQQLKMQPFSVDLLNSADTYTWNMDQTTQRPMVNYKNQNYGLDFSWDSSANCLGGCAVYAPYVVPSGYQVETWDTKLNTPYSRNFHGTEAAGGWSQVQGIDAGLCYNPSQQPDYPITGGSYINWRSGKPMPPTWESSFANTPGCNWIDFNTVYNCCAMPGFTETNPGTCLSTPGGYSNNNSQSCQNIMLQMCENKWDNTICKDYLGSFRSNPDVTKVVNKTVQNYINSMSTRYPCKYSDGSSGTNDYTTPNQGNMCKLSDGTLRDDSKDPFINNTLVELCSTISDSPGNCDLILDQYCAQFTVQDMENDATLQKICGCHLSTQVPQPSPGGLNLGNKTIQPNQYIYPGMPKACNPICAFAGTIPSAGPPCKQTVCVMDNVSINEINSNCGDMTINQVCGQSAGQDGVGNCYIANSEVNIINSTCSGGKIQQQCSNCFVFDSGDDWSSGGPANAKKVDCSNLAGTGSGGGGGGGGGTGTQPKKGGVINWMENHRLAVAGIIFGIMFLIMLFLILVLA